MIAEHQKDALQKSIRILGKCPEIKQSSTRVCSKSFKNRFTMCPVFTVVVCKV